MALVCLSDVTRDVYLDVYGFRDDPLEDLDIPREKLPWLPSVFSAVDLLANNLKKLDPDSVKDMPDSCIAEFLVYVTGFMANDEKSQTTKWLKALFNILEQPHSVLQYWMKKLEFKIDESSKDQRRLLRQTEPYDNIFLRILTGVFNTVRSLDLAEVLLIYTRTTTSHSRRVSPLSSRSSKLNTRRYQRGMTKTRCSPTWRESWSR